MKKITSVFMLLISGIIYSSVIMADNVIISGEIFGTETLAPGPSGCSVSERYPHVLAGPFRVSSSGTYYVIDGAFWIDYDVTGILYQNSYDINNPDTNKVAELDDDDAVTLNMGTDYYLVIQPWCGNFPGVYATTISGPGDITGADVIQPYDYMAGVFRNSDPVGDITDFADCSSTVYNVSAPFQVANSGAYHFVDIGEYVSPMSSNYVDSSVTFYEGSFDANNPAANRVVSMDDWGFLDLRKGKDYRVVTQPWCKNLDDRGEWFFILLPSQALFLNHGLSGAWFNPATAGQGILLEIYEQSRYIFAAWFTYDTSQPDPATEYRVGHSGHRWLTAEGGFAADSSSVTIPAYLFKGGLFDDPTEVDPAQDEGSITLEFEDCSNATMTYDLTAAQVDGSFPLKRILEDNAAKCTAETAEPAPFVNDEG
jgi:hypothetical protein